MAFCTKCGKKLIDGEKCSCRKSNLTTNGINTIRNAFNNSSNQIDFLERNKTIVPDCVSADDGEKPIKQYKLAKLRSKIRGQYAEGRLQVTNKRLLFRAAGASALGKTIVQQEFAINDIAGVEVQKGNKVSILNIIGAILLSCFLSETFREIVEPVYTRTAFIGTLFSLLVFVSGVVLFFTLKKKNWLKLALFSSGIGALLGTSNLSFSALDIVFGFKLFTFTNILIFILSLGWFYLLLQVCFVPDLTFSVKTNAASEAVHIKRRIWGFLFKQPQENTGFSEVLPWDDAEAVANELGAIINDLQTLGDMAIDKWKE